MSIKITPGIKINNLTVLKFSNEIHIEPSGKKRKKVLVRCKCGLEFLIQTIVLHRKGEKCKQCRFTTNSIVTIGESYGNLSVINFVLTGNKKRALCKCACSNIVKARPELLKNGTTKNCGCKHTTNWKGIGKLSHTIFGRIQRNAKTRNLPFLITIDYAWNLYLQQNGKCKLTGLDIKLQDINNEASLDRIDSNLGYVESNVQWVHKDVNYMKMDLDQDRFVTLCKLIANHTSLCNLAT